MGHLTLATIQMIIIIWGPIVGISLWYWHHFIRTPKKQFDEYNKNQP